MNKKEVTKHQGIKKHFVRFFEELYRSNIKNTTGIKNYLDGFEKVKVPDKLIKELNKLVTTEEISEAEQKTFMWTKCGEDVCTETPTFQAGFPGPSPYQEGLGTFQKGQSDIT